MVFISRIPVAALLILICSIMAGVFIFTDNYTIGVLCFCMVPIIYIRHLLTHAPISKGEEAGRALLVGIIEYLVIVVVGSIIYVMAFYAYAHRRIMKLRCGKPAR